MARTYVITAQHNPLDGFKDTLTKGDKRKYSFDFSPWAEDNNTISAVTWTVESGSATISAEALSSNVATALITVADTGRSIIKIAADTGTEQYIVWLNVFVRDPSYEYVNDYGFG